MMLFTGRNGKLHIFKKPNYENTYCGLNKIWIGTIGHWCGMPSKKMLKYYKNIIYKKCLKIGLLYDN